MALYKNADEETNRLVAAGPPLKDEKRRMETLNYVYGNTNFKCDSYPFLL